MRVKFELNQHIIRSCSFELMLSNRKDNGRLNYRVGYRVSVRREITEFSRLLLAALYTNKECFIPFPGKLQQIDPLLTLQTVL